ncbi:hypothetical protein [Maricaulis sp.]|uniref:hypothetical protein n=1 Tax=Maricaulis sp. TaxID=1486257 RepID=UPI00260AB995|nr:hypothetical protein [Maricaulis sp.]
MKRSSVKLIAYGAGIAAFALMGAYFYYGFEYLLFLGGFAAGIFAAGGDGLFGGQ